MKHLTMTISLHDKLGIQHSWLIFYFNSHPRPIAAQVKDAFLLCIRSNTLGPLGQKAEQRAGGISFHALPPQPQMFSSKTSPLIQVAA